MHLHPQRHRTPPSERRRFRYRLDDRRQLPELSAGGLLPERRRRRGPCSEDLRLLPGARPMPRIRAEQRIEHGVWGGCSERGVPHPKRRRNSTLATTVTILLITTAVTPDEGATRSHGTCRSVFSGFSASSLSFFAGIVVSSGCPSVLLTGRPLTPAELCRGSSRPRQLRATEQDEYHDDDQDDLGRGRGKRTCGQASTAVAWRSSGGDLACSQRGGRRRRRRSRSDRPPQMPNFSPFEERGPEAVEAHDTASGRPPWPRVWTCLVLGRTDQDPPQAVRLVLQFAPRSVLPCTSSCLRCNYNGVIVPYHITCAQERIEESHCRVAPRVVANGRIPPDRVASGSVTRARHAEWREPHVNSVLRARPAPGMRRTSHREASLRAVPRVRP